MYSSNLLFTYGYKKQLWLMELLILKEKIIIQTLFVNQLNKN